MDSGSESERHGLELRSEHSLAVVQVTDSPQNLVSEFVY